MTTKTLNRVRIAAVTRPDTAAAVQELAARLDQPDPELVLYFASSRHEPARLSAAMEAAFPGRSVGCTTGGELGPDGYRDGTLVGLSLGPGPIRARHYALPGASALLLDSVRAARDDFVTQRRHPQREIKADCLGLLLLNGLQRNEEHIVAALHHQFQGIPLVGGCAGDDYAFVTTHVYCGDRVITDGAAFVALEMGGVPFRTFRLQDFAPISDPLVVTGADPDRRLVWEIDGEPALAVYAAAVGIPAAELTMGNFASHSLMVSLGGRDYIRSVMCCEGEEALKLHAAIDEGMVVRIARSADTLRSLEAFLDPASAVVRDTSFAVVFDCMHRRMELRRQEHLEEAEVLLGQLPLVGFTTYGEVIDALHVNQTMTGVLVGTGADRGW